MRSLALPFLIAALSVQTAQAQTQLQTTRGQLIDIGVARAQMEHAIAVLVGRINMMEPLIGYAMKGMNDDGIRIPDFTKFEGRLAESWDYDPESLTWTLHLRHGVIGCSGNEFTAADGRTGTGWSRYCSTSR